MAFFLKAKKMDMQTGQLPIALLNEVEAYHYGIRAGDRIKLQWNKTKITASANTSRRRIKPGQIGLYQDIWKKHKVANNTIIEVAFQENPRSIKAIKKRLLGKKLSYNEIYEIIYDIANDNLTRVQTTYFVASSFSHEPTNLELYYLTKAMAETGDMLGFPGVVADKHSVGGLAGNRTTMIVIPIIAALGITIPKTSSRAITSPAGTADTMEVLAEVSFSADKIRQIVKKNHACMVWGGGLNLAPADDKILKVSYPLALEPYDKMIVSIMAKKVATGITHLIIDMPVGKTTKIPDIETAKKLQRKFKFVADKFGIKIKVILTTGEDPIGLGIGPALEARDVLRVLQRKKERPGDLENKAIHLAGELLELIRRAGRGEGAKLAWETLESGKAWESMRKILRAQGGNPNVKPEEITLGAHKHYVSADRDGKITFTDNKGINTVCRVLGAPIDKMAGIYLNKEYGMKVKKGERLFTLYAESKSRIKLALKALEKLTIFRIQ